MGKTWFTETLKSIVENYGTVKIQILLIECLPNMNRVFCHVLQQEKQLSESLRIKTKSLIDNIGKQQQKMCTKDNNHMYG